MGLRDDHILKCYSPSYEGARRAFLGAAAERGIGVFSRRNPAAKGNDGEDLFMDIARLGDQSARNVLIISSGTHGIEGYAGSALQVALLKSAAAEMVPANTVCYLVHAVNPFGFSYHRRVNESNVDLNRNFVDFSGQLPGNGEFAEFRAFADREIRAGGAMDEAEAASRYREKEGEQRYQRALTTGQYTDPAAIYYGGSQPSWSNRTWRRFLDKFLAGKSVAVHMDIHTGLGSRGSETLIYTRCPRRQGFDLARSCFGAEDLLVPGGAITPDVSGPIPSSFSRFERDMPVIGVAPEFGTVPLNDMLSLLIEENVQWQDGHRSGQSRHAVIQAMLDCFCPDDARWRTGIWRRFNRRFEQAIAFLDKA